MKKTYFTGIFGASLLFLSLGLKAQELNAMTQQREVLKVYTDLIDKQIDLEKEKQNNIKILDKTKDLNHKSERKTDRFNSSDPNSTADDARKTAKLLKRTESANKELQRSNNKIVDMEGDIRKLQMKLEKLKYAVELKEKQ